ncbi:hypothetical protein CH289_04425 [Rhodococcus sp. RS1C4]|nr:hypothetical protein CH289_04425 [Rhodococcus sp. RS1C4]
MRVGSVRRGMAVAFAMSSAVVLAACSSGTGSEPATEISSLTDFVETTTTNNAGDPSEAVANESSSRIVIEVGGRTVIGNLNDSAASRDLLDQLPLTIEMSDHGSVEKTGPLPAELSTSDSPSRADPNPGDVGYYAPGDDFVLYYGDQVEFPGIVILGRMDSSGSDAVGSVDGDVTVTVTRSS